MLAAFVQGPLFRLIPVGLLLLTLQTTLFVDLQPAGVMIQVMLALAAATGAGGGADRGALAGFVLGLMYDLGTWSPLGSTALTMSAAGIVAGLAWSITVNPPWWLAMIFTMFGAAVGEVGVPVVRSFIGDHNVFTPELYTIVPVVTIAAGVFSPVFVPLSRWCMRIKRSEWKAPPE